MSVPGITRSSTKWQARYQSSGRTSASPRTRPSPSGPPRVSHNVIRWTSAIRPPGSRAGARRGSASKGAPKAAPRSPRRSASTPPASSMQVPASTGGIQSGRVPAPEEARSTFARTIPCPPSSSSFVKNPAHPSVIVRNRRPSTVASKWNRKRWVSPCRKNRSMRMS